MCRMTTASEQAQRLARTLEFSAERLAQRIQPLQTQSQRLALARLFVLLGGIAGAALAAIFFNATAAWLVLAIAIGAFLILVVWHRRLDQWIETLTLWRAIKLDRRARLFLDWENLPPPRPIAPTNQTLAYDLDLTGYRSLHQALDTTISRRGAQWLAEWLAAAQPDVNGLQTRQAIVRELKARARFRDRFQLTYRRVLRRELESENLLAWLKTEFPSARLRRALPFAILLVAANWILFALWQFAAFPPFFLGVLGVYIAFYYWRQNDLEIALGAVARLHTELDKFRALVEYLERASYRGAPHLAALCAPFQNAAPAPSRQLRAVSRIAAAVGLRSNPLLAILLNVALPWDFLFAYLADRQRARIADALPEWTRAAHELDALIALGNFAALHPAATFPEIRADAACVLRATQLGHPLIPFAQRVGNDFEIGALGQVDILTGSNMAGKSTFLKTVGVNFCLAYAGAPVVAQTFIAQPLRLHACIRIADSLADGFSYFYAEVKCLRALLEKLQAPEELPLLYLIDEIFRGTNNRERLIGSRAYIAQLLGARGAGLIATHDLELAQFADADARAQNFHFRDAVRDGRLVFDYRLRAGACPTTNALKIMELEGLPT